MKRLLAEICIILIFLSFIRGQAPAAAGEEAAFCDGDAWEAVKTAAAKPADESKEAEKSSISLEETLKIQKVAYLKGLYEGLTAGEIITNRKNTMLKKIPPYNSGRLISLLDEFYSDSSNEDIPVIDALTIIKMKLNDEPPSKIQVTIENLRQSNLNVDDNF